jgi:hypothetical protein
MDDGKCVYFGPWNPHAQQLLSRYLPASHVLAAAGGAEQPTERKKKPAAAAKGKEVRSVLLFQAGDCLAEVARQPIPTNFLHSQA